MNTAEILLMNDKLNDGSNFNLITIFTRPAYGAKALICLMADRGFDDRNRFAITMHWYFRIDLSYFVLEPIYVPFWAV